MIADKFAKTVSSFLPTDLGDEIKKNTQAAVRSAFDRMDLVTREELEVQQKVLQRTREKIEQLEQQVAELEKALLNK